MNIHAAETVVRHSIVVEAPIERAFMQTDPIGYGDGMNMYAYVGNDPVNAIDPSGLDDYVWVTHPCPSFRNAPPPPDDKPFDGPVVEVTGTPSCGSWVPRTSGPGGGGGGDGGGGGGGGGPQGEEKCWAITEGIRDLTGGESNKSFVDDVVENFVNVKDTGASTVASGVLSAAGGSTTAAAWGGVTPLQAVGLAWSAHNSPVRIPGMIGIRTPLQLVGTAGASWLINTVLIKGAYNAGLLVGSVARTAINRAATAACTE